MWACALRWPRQPARKPTHPEVPERQAARQSGVRPYGGVEGQPSLRWPADHPITSNPPWLSLM